ncbi:MAG TPA: TonB-dependent receptor [Bryobacteraceae bacterium]|nr:TonB-dependent receptor [Bryobacteraceae bacterium]
MGRFRFELAAGLLVMLAFASLSLRADVILRGRVVDENNAPVRGARVTARPANLAAIAGANSREAQTDPDGSFTVTFPAPGDYFVSVTRQGFYAVKDRPIRVESGAEITLAINTVREVFQSANVNEQTSPVDITQAQNEERLTGTELNDVPYANSHSLRNSLSLLPGVVQEPAGPLHFDGSSENQILYLLDGFNITDPISGQFQTLLAVEGIRSVDLSTGRYSPEYGKGSAGVLDVNADNGTDAFHYTATNFLPGLSIQQGLHLGNWYPRFGFSGPIVRGRAWFSDMFDSEYNETVVTGLPKGQNTRSGWAGSNLLHTQSNLTPSNILFADFLVNVDDESRIGLGPLNPVPTTSTVDTREYFGSVKDQEYFGHGMLMEFGYAHNYFSNMQMPQGQSPYILTPTGNSGNYFVNSRQTAARNQSLIHAYFPKFKFAGTHQIEAGAGMDWLHYNGNFRRTGYQVLGPSDVLISETLFPTPAQFNVGDREQSSFLLDTWRVTQRLQFNLGVREDWDQAIHAAALSPRLSASWSPFASGRTRISGGYAITHDAVTLGMLGLPLDQIGMTTEYGAGGVPVGPPALTAFSIPNSGLALPRATNWTLGVDHQLTEHVYLNAKYLRRRGTDGFVFVNTLAPDAPASLLPLPDGAMGGAYQLTNLRRDNYDSVQISARQTFSGQYEWMASYTRSQAISNALLDPNSPQPLQLLPNFVPIPWDAPNRFLGWTYLPLPWKNWAISALADLRTGFPFSIRDPSGLVIGAVDSYRYPLNFDLNIAIERIVTFRGYRFALRGGVDNLTNQANPTAVNNVTGVPQYLQFLGDEGRHFVVRIRFFGRVNSK